MNASATYIMVAHSIGTILGHVFTLIRQPVVSKPMGLGLVYLAGKNHDFISTYAGEIIKFFLGGI